LEPPGLRDRLARLLPGFQIVRVEPLSPDATARSPTAKAVGYGVPLRITLEEPSGGRRLLVFRTAAPNDFGHDRRSDRAQQMLLAYDTFGVPPRHVEALDVGAIGQDGRLVSVRDCGEFYLLTSYAAGQIYAQDLRRIASEGEIRSGDMDRCRALARYLVALHAQRGGRPALYARAVRDLVGHGEGVFGIVDGYPDGVPAAPPERLRAIEARCLDWRWRLRGKSGRLARTHGDFHPFNILFDEGDELAILDTSRGSQGDPADDVVCMAINYVFFALEKPSAWHLGLGALWDRFWEEYLRGTGDAELLEVAAPFLAWRGLVLACPHWYPALAAEARDRLLGFIEGALGEPRFDPACAHALFR
jgi:Phosphotransferase enzyme family